MMASRPNGTLYVGVTSNLAQRVWQHKQKLAPGFTSRYNVQTLVWFEQHETMANALSREKAIKEWKRAWKVELIREINLAWRDLYPDIV